MNDKYIFDEARKHVMDLERSMFQTIVLVVQGKGCVQSVGGGVHPSVRIAEAKLLASAWEPILDEGLDPMQWFVDARECNPMLRMGADLCCMLQFSDGAIAA